MLKLIKLVAFAAVMFAISAAGSWVIQTRQHGGHDPHAEQAAPHAATDAPPESTVHTAPQPAAQPAAPGDLPVVVRPKMLTPEDILRNAMSLRAREELLQQREQAAQQEQLRLQLVQADIEAEQTAIAGLRAAAQSQIDAANQLLARIAEERARLEHERQQSAEQLRQFEQTRSEMDALEQQNLKRMSTWVQGMEAQTAAAFIRELANDGKMDVAVQMLANFEEREAAKVLEAINDPMLMVELTEKFRTLKRPQKTATRK